MCAQYSSDRIGWVLMRRERPMTVGGWYSQTAGASSMIVSNARRAYERARAGSKAVFALSRRASTTGLEYAAKFEPSLAMPAVDQVCLNPDTLGSVPKS